MGGVSPATPVALYLLVKVVRVAAAHCIVLQRLVQFYRTAGKNPRRDLPCSAYSTLGVSLEPRARSVLCRQAVKLALGSQASVLPVLSVTLASLHEEWKWRRIAEEASKTPAPSATPLGLKLIAVGPRHFDIEMQDLDEHRQIDRAIARLGELAWNETSSYEAQLREQILSLPITGPRQRVSSGEISPFDFALAWLLRHLVAISGQEGVPDRLVPLPDSSMPAFARPLAESLQRNRILTRYEDGSWWLVHQAVLSGWDRAAAWRKAENASFLIMDRMANDHARWKEETDAADPHASHWLWVSPRYIESAVEWLTLRGADDYPELAGFVRQSLIAAAAQDASLAGRFTRRTLFARRRLVRRYGLVKGHSGSRGSQPPAGVQPSQHSGYGFGAHVGLPLSEPRTCPPSSR
jgi:hypothetical protein